MRSKIFLSLLLASFVVIFPVSADALALPIPNDEKEMIKTKREGFKERLQTISDEAKRLLTERIDTKMAVVNQKTTTRFSTVLEKLESILNRIIATGQDLKVKGIDTAALDSATLSAQKAIDNAKSTVASQTAMIYIIQIASESALKSSVGSTVSQLRQDLKDVHKAVVDAKQAVQKAIMERAKLRSSVTGSAQ